jgi:hypothetical protein
MDKKNRTGLQSKISQIFSGVPIPKKRKPLSEDIENKNKDELPSVLHNPEDEIIIEDAVIEKYTAEPQKISLEKRDNIIEDSSAQTGAIPHTDEEFSDEEFSVVQDSDSGTLIQTDRKDENGAEEISIIEAFESSGGRTEQKPSSEHLQNPQSPSSPAKKTNIQKAIHPDLKFEKTGVDGNVSVPPVKGQIVDKPEPAFSRKLEIPDSKESLGVQKSIVGKISGFEAGNNTDLRSSRKISAKPVLKRQKLKPGASQGKQKIMIALFTGLLIILFVVLNKNFHFFGLHSSNTQPPEPPSPGVAVVKNTGNVLIDWPETPVYPDNIPDPMGNDIDQQQVSPAKTLFVKGIAYNEKGVSVVTINTENYKINETIRDYDATIINITNTTVEFRNSDDVTWTRTIGDSIEY